MSCFLDSFSFPKRYWFLFSFFFLSFFSLFSFSFFSDLSPFPIGFYSFLNKFHFEGVLQTKREKREKSCWTKRRGEKGICLNLYMFFAISLLILFILSFLLPSNRFFSFFFWKKSEEHLCYESFLFFSLFFEVCFHLFFFLFKPSSPPPLSYSSFPQNLSNI